MSLVTNGLIKKLCDDARVADEHATTRLWEYLLRMPFDGLEWVRSSQQPPTSAVNSLRRVDYIIEHVDMDGGHVTKVLFMEAKRYGAEERDVRECEMQAWEAAMVYSLHEGGGRPCWFQTCIGTSSRLWIYDPQHEHPIAFLPGAFSLARLDHHLDVTEYGEDILKALRYIAKHHRPPAKFLEQSSPLISSPGASSEVAQSPGTASRAALKTLTAGQTQIIWYSVRGT